MSTEFRIAVVIILVILVWVYAKVRYYMKKSAQQWQDADKSKLRKWEEDEL